MTELERLQLENEFLKERLAKDVDLKTNMGMEQARRFVEMQIKEMLGKRRMIHE